MLQEAPDEWKVKIVASHNNRKRKTETVAEELQGDIVYMRSMTWQEDYALLVPRCLLSYASQPQHLFARDVDSLVVSPE